ncbi:peptidase M55 D-aminopeptidase [Pyrolobus fumarii 1A]|uniref:Peptidase M55 D-aminopeptidase n=1 Tax=Pyrolobus fumarii (strain DSM 11204 / 1A) TaxID=694429 RepID=G0EDV2_PYRF1|nr:peptidase M55 D-aminopeptidase [Pyrolobus fumarii 1A]
MPSALISLDFEGLPYIVSSRHQLGPDGRLWGEARRIATKLAKLVSQKLIEAGYEKVIVADSHGLMINIEPLEFPRGVVLVTGFPRASPAMVPLVESVDVAIFLGYHARAGERSVLAHTYAGRYVEEVVVNGMPASEYLLNALYLGENGIPVGLVAGSAELMEEVERYTPWAERVVLKRSLGFLAAVSPSLQDLEEALVKALQAMNEKLEKGELKPLKPKTPVEVTIRLTSPLYADVSELLPGARRVDGRTIAYKAETMEQAMRMLELLLYAWVGAASIAGK